MTIDTLRTIFFSPTGTTRKIINSIAKGINLPVKESIDLTQSLPGTNHLEGNVLTLIGVPVYSGRVPLQAIERLQQLKAENTPAVIVVVYGNRAYEDALIELKNELTKLGFTPISGGAFISEHSWDTDNNPIATGRPDKDDLQKAQEFGRSIAVKINNSKMLEPNSQLKVPGNEKYKERKILPKMKPIVDESLCDTCGQCEDVCPVSAIQVGSEVKMDENKCILCSACIKQCPQKAIQFKDPWLSNVMSWLSTNYNERKEPEFFF